MGVLVCQALWSMRQGASLDLGDGAMMMVILVVITMMVIMVIVMMMMVMSLEIYLMQTRIIS